MKICNKILQIGLLSAALGSLFGCSVAGRLQRQQMTASLSQLTRAERQERQQDYRPQVVKLQRDSNTFFLAPVDTLADGERVMALQIEQVTVVAKMRSIPERNGRVVLDFIVTLPRQLLGKSRSVVITPILHKPDESVALEDLVIRGGRFSLLQERDYWQYETYVERFRPDTVGREAAFNRFVKFPYPEDVRLDSLVEGRSTVTYYYSQAVKTDETSKKMLVTLQGQVLAVDDSAYRLPPSDTLSYVVSSMLSFVDTVPRYRIKVIDKFVTVEDRNYIQFFVGDTRVVDTLGDNRQLDKISGLMRQIVEAFLLDKRAEAARERKMFRYKAFYSLDCNDGIENAAIGWAQPSPEDHLIEKEELAEYEELIRRLYEAISSLSPIQARRVHARYILGMKVKDIAAMEGITPSQAGKSIHAALRRLRRYFARQKWTVNL